MSVTRRRGLSDEIGSWKIIWTCVRSVRRSLRLSVGQLRVAEADRVPTSACSTCTMARPVVDFPQPDSPDQAEGLSRRACVKLTPATAWTVVLPFWNVDVEVFDRAASGVRCRPRVRGAVPGPSARRSSVIGRVHRPVRRRRRRRGGHGRRRGAPSVQRVPARVDVPGRRPPRAVASRGGTCPGRRGSAGENGQPAGGWIRSAAGRRWRRSRVWLGLASRGIESSSASV